MYARKRGMYLGALDRGETGAGSKGPTAWPERTRGVHLEAAVTGTDTYSEDKDGGMLPGSRRGKVGMETKRKDPSGEYRCSSLLELHPDKPTVDWKYPKS